MAASKTQSTGETGVNKSQAIRDYLAEHAGAESKDIVAGLKEKGIDVTPGLIGLVRFQANRKSAPAGAKTATGSKSVQKAKAAKKVRRASKGKASKGGASKGGDTRRGAGFAAGRSGAGSGRYGVKAGRGGKKTGGAGFATGRKSVATGVRSAASGGKRAASGNKSDAVRDHLAGHPDASPNDVREALAKKGISISTSLAAAVKYGKGGKGKKGAKKSGRRGVGRPRVVASTAGAAALDYEVLIEAKRLAERLGGIDNAREALSILARLA